jgi:hypothetical protein
MAGFICKILFISPFDIICRNVPVLNAWQKIMMFKHKIYSNTTMFKVRHKVFFFFFVTGKTVQFDDVCFYCGDVDVLDTIEIKRLKEEFGIVRPICAECKKTKPVKTRSSLKTKKRK